MKSVLDHTFTETPRLRELRKLSKLHEEATILHLALQMLLMQARVLDAPIETRRRIDAAAERAFRRAFRRYDRIMTLGEQRLAS